MSTRSFARLIGVATVSSLLMCAVGHGAEKSRKKKSGEAAKYVPIDQQSRVSGVGIETQDIVGMTDKMVRDMMSNPALAGRASPPRVIVDAQYFINDSGQAINKNMITDRLRVGLVRASQGRLVFVTRENAEMVEQERAQKRDGVTDTGTTGLTRAVAGADYRLSGRISDLEVRDPKTGLISRGNQIIFEMTDLETAVVVWSDIYEFRKEGSDDLVYR
jgi:penicillin-binding protein activator